jgi:hypothetical protein
VDCGLWIVQTRGYGMDNKMGRANPTPNAQRPIIINHQINVVFYRIMSSFSFIGCSSR